MQNKYNLTLEENIFLAKRNLIDNVYSSAKMEGLNITFPETKTILEGVNVPNLNIDEIQCVLNLRDAWKYVIEHIADTFSIEFICKINEFVARNESLSWGKLRNGTVEITGTDYIPPIPVEADVVTNLNKIMQIKSPTEKAIEYMLYGMRSQLFWDGNKRTSTICANKIMIENGCGIIKVSDAELKSFTNLLSEFYSTDDNSKIKQFIFDNCIDGISYEN